MLARAAWLAVLLTASAAAFQAPVSGLRGVASSRALVAPRAAAGAPEVLSEESVERVLEAARTELSAVFGYSAENRAVGITGTVDFVELEGPTVVVRFGGRFWHKRTDVLTRVAAFLEARIPEICDVSIEDVAQLDDADKVAQRPDF
jgi:hypothetical protein